LEEFFEVGGKDRGGVGGSAPVLFPKKIPKCLGDKKEMAYLCSKLFD